MFLAYLGLALCVALSLHIIHRITRVQKTMTDTNQALLDLAAALDAETNDVAARLDHLSAQLASALSNGQAPKAETIAALQGISDRLKSLGADPAAPIPAPVAPVTQPEAAPVP